MKLGPMPLLAGLALLSLGFTVSVPRAFHFVPGAGTELHHLWEGSIHSRAD